MIRAHDKVGRLGDVAYSKGNKFPQDRLRSAGTLYNRGILALSMKDVIAATKFFNDSAEVISRYK